MSDDGLLHDRCHTDDGPVRAGKAARVSETPETTAAFEVACNSGSGTRALGHMLIHSMKLERERDELRAMWERDSTALGVAIGQRDTARAVSEDNRARYVTAESERDELRGKLDATCSPESFADLVRQRADLIRHLERSQGVEAQCARLVRERDELREALREMRTLAVANGWLLRSDLVDIMDRTGAILAGGRVR
jgi:hypothetical protein